MQSKISPVLFSLSRSLARLSKITQIEYKQLISVFFFFYVKSGQLGYMLVLFYIETCPMRCHVYEHIRYLEKEERKKKKKNNNHLSSNVGDEVTIHGQIMVACQNSGNNIYT